MKKFFTLIVLFFTGLIVSHAQTTVPDQNPNYLESQEKYTWHKDSLLAGSNTTIQQTYKAYDFYQARLERRAQRRERRYNVNLTRAQYGGYYPSYGYSNYGYNSWNNGYYNSFIPSIGFRSGNWRFGW
ncbi:hypothetical protein SAMN05421788_1011345 [Filimonas lacunae]|uniref:Uncharacterized protein n=1 Tax=Filimonas lacunae TaxID=477680 RepID=A0A173MQH6_9BACT|nr:hypothetical protein [Filimonas lacunae]BAV09912.1 hypothetical protein FLA_5965 [Filimonas lacunae]SIS80929.1 hypothetical protein SAMN05421788_1011345 [Filimonas lacunae]